MPPFAVHMLTKFQFSYPSIQPSDSQFKFDFEFSRIVSDLPVPVVALWHWGVLHLMCSCLCFCSWCVAIIICNWNLFKLLSAIFSSCVLFLCAGDERNGHKATWEHLLRVTINIPLSLFIFFSFTPQQVWEYLLRVTSHWHCLSSFAFAHQQVYLLLLLLSHINKSISFTFTFTLNQVYQIDFIRRQSFYREEEEASVSSLLAEDSSKASPRGQVIKQFQSNMTDPVL